MLYGKIHNFAFKLMDMHRLSFFLLVYILLAAPAVCADDLKKASGSVPSADSLQAPPMMLAGMPIYGSWRGYESALYPVHQGLNASLSLSATMGLGGNTPSGVGFGRDVNMVYASQAGKLVYTLGANTSQLDWGGWHYNQAGIGGTLNYIVSDKVSLGLTGYKELVHPDRLGYPCFRRDNYIGGAVNMKFTDNIFLQVSIGTSTWKY